MSNDETVLLNATTDKKKLKVMIMILKGSYMHEFI